MWLLLLVTVPSLALAYTASAAAPVPEGSEFHVDTYTTDRQIRPAVSSSSNGDFIVVWDSYGSAGTDTDSRSIQGQRYSVPEPAWRCSS